MNVLSGLYGRATELRRAWYGRHPHRTRRLERPVISVGNLVLGGSGKTPLVAALARLLIAAGERPAILSRGYGRRDVPDGVVVVSDGERVLAAPTQSGDEPYMLARALAGVPVLVSPDRHLAGRLAERRLGCTVHLLDDGFQHVQLARDVDLVVMSRADLEERVLPSGKLREPLVAARAADALFVAGADGDIQAISNRVGVETAFRIVPRYDAPRLISPFGAALPPSTGRKIVAVAGIARPERFFAALRELGWEVVRELIFRDHHWFTPRDVAAIHRAASEAGADLVITTEKDAVRLEDPVARTLSGSRGGPDKACPTVWTFLPLEIAIDPLDQFASWLCEQLSAARREAA